MAPGMPIFQPTVTAAGAEPVGPDREIPLRITATLTEPITIPSPPAPPAARAPSARMGPEEEMMYPDMMDLPEGGEERGVRDPMRDRD